MDSRTYHAHEADEAKETEKGKSPDIGKGDFEGW